MEDSNSSSFIYPASGLSGMSEQFEEITIVKRTSHNILARARRYGRWWMLKGLLPEEANDPIYKEMLRKELEIMAPLSHPAIVQTFGLDIVEGLGMCIVMEWIEGEPLNDYISAHHPSKEQLKRLLRQLTEAVSYMHQHGIVHRDLKPQNIMVTHNGAYLKLIDFGLADTDSFAILKQPSGTRAYIAPEQANGSQPDVRNDIYSLGVIIRELNIDSNLDAVVRRCTQPIDRRYHDMDELMSALQSATVKHKSDWLKYVGILFGTLAVGILGLLWLLQPEKPVIVTDVRQLSNTKQYYIHTLKNRRGSLGVYNNCLATNYKRATHFVCEQPSTFAVIRHENAYFLYSVADHRFINAGNWECDAPLANKAFHEITLTPLDSAIAIDFHSSNNHWLTLNVNAGNGIIVTDYGTENGMYDEGNQFVFEEAGDFDPAEALAMMQEPNPEYQAALSAIEEGQQYAIYTLCQGKHNQTPTRYYLASSGKLTDTLTDSCVFTIHKMADEYDLPYYRDTCWRVSYYKDDAEYSFTNRMTNNGDVAAVEGSIKSMPFTSNSWQGQVFLLGANGNYAIRSTNIASMSYASHTYWAVYDLNSDELPEADYSEEPQYVWHLSISSARSTLSTVGGSTPSRR